MDPIEIIVTSVESLSSTPSATSYQSSPNGRPTQHADRTLSSVSASSELAAAKSPSPVTVTSTPTHRLSTDRWHSTRLGANENNNGDHKTDDKIKRPLLSLSIPNSQSSHSLHTPKTAKQATTQYSGDSTGRCCGGLCVIICIHSMAKNDI